MIRLASIFLGFFPLLFITTIKSEDVKITQQAKSKVYQGEEFVVEVKVEKGDIEGFAKYQLDIPAGISAEQVEVLGATFTYDEGTIKIIWLALPSKNEFTFTYKVKIAEDAVNQKFDLEGRFSYLEENNRMIAEANKIVIQIGDTEEEILATKPAEPAFAQATRDITKMEDGSFQVEVTINKSNIDGFSKIEDVYPQKYEVTAIEDGNGVFSYVKNKAKFVWMNTPKDESYSIKYQVKSESGTVDFKSVIGEFSYLDNNETKKVAIAQGVMPEVSVEKLMANQDTPPKEPETKPKETPKETEKVKEAAKPKVEKKKTEPVASPAAKQTEEVAEINVPEVTSQPIEASSNEKINKNSLTSPQDGLIYRVQILAGKNLVNAAYFKKNHQYEENFITENHKGLVKYTTGQFDVYKGARDKREDLNGKYTLPGPFVAAYNNGQRITVQEALMISNQKWYK